MSLKKICRCGKLIDYGQQYCTECQKKYGLRNSRQYDKTVRHGKDKQYTEFYHSSEWIKVTQEIKQKYKGLDIYSYYILGKIEYGNICHHIRPIKDTQGWKDRFNIDGIVYLTNANHSIVHKMLDENYEKTISMMSELIKKWNEEFIT